MADAISFSEIMITWDTVLPIDQNGVIVEYEVHYWLMQSSGSVVTANVSEFALNLTGLSQLGSYNISIRAYTIVGAGPYSETITIRIPPPGKECVSSHSILA